MRCNTGAVDLMQGEAPDSSPTHQQACRHQRTDNCGSGIAPRFPPLLACSSHGAYMRRQMRRRTGSMRSLAGMHDRPDAGCRRKPVRSLVYHRRQTASHFGKTSLRGRLAPVSSPASCRPMPVCAALVTCNVPQLDAVS